MATSDDWKLQWTESDRRFYQTINEIRLQRGMSLISHPSLQSENEEHDRTILIKIHFELYPISWEILDTIFSKFGSIEYLEVLCPGEEFHSKIRFKNKASTIEAFESLNQRNIYDRCCLMELFLGNSLNSSSSLNQGEAASDEVEGSKSPTEETSNDQETTASNHEIIDRMRSGLNSTPEDIADKNQEINVDRILEFSTLHQLEGDISEEILVQYESSGAEGWQQSSNPENKDVKEPHVQSNNFEVNLDSCDVIFDEAVNELAKLVGLLIEWMEIRLATARDVIKVGLSMNSIDSLRNLNACTVFVKMTGLKVVWCESRLRVGRSMPDQNLALVGQCCYLDLASGMNLVFDPGGKFKIEVSNQQGGSSSLGSAYCSLKFTNKMRNLFPFDRGRDISESTNVFQVQLNTSMKSVTLIFDPDGGFCSAGYSEMLQLLHKCLPLGLRAATCYRITCTQHFIRQLCALAMIDPLRVKSRDRLYTHLVGFVGLMVYHILDGNVIFYPGGELDSCMAFSSCHKKILIAVLHECHAELQWVVVPGFEDIGPITRDHGGCKIHNSFDCLLLEGFNEVG